MKKLLAICLVATFVAGCEQMPRGAALQSEILDETNDPADPDGVLPDFQVAPVTRATVGEYASWPRVGEPRLGWIDRVRQPANQIIRPGDALDITVWSSQDSSLLTAPGQRFVAMPSMQVSSTGRVFLPYIGQVRVSGMSPERAREVIEGQYLNVAPSAQVQVAHKPGRNSSVNLVGGVSRPGSYPMPDQDYTLMALLAAGGGVNPSMKSPQVRLHRGGKTYGLSVEELYDNPSRDTTLIGGDKVVVQEDDRKFLSLGAARSEAVHYFGEERVTALEAISIIGGVTDSRADPGGVLILRTYPASAVKPSGPDESRVIFTIDLTNADGLFSAGEFEIRPDDLIYVTESPLTATQSILGAIGQLFGVARTAKAL